MPIVSAKCLSIENLLILHFYCLEFYPCGKLIRSKSFSSCSSILRGKYPFYCPSYMQILDGKNVSKYIVKNAFFFQLSITHNKLLVNVFWRLVSAFRSSHHQATRQGGVLHPYGIQSLYVSFSCVVAWWWLRLKVEINRQNTFKSSLLCDW